MKKLILVTVISLGNFALIGCGNTAEKANTEAPPDQTFKVDELVNKVIGDKDAWKGKGVIVAGRISGIASNNLILNNKKWDKESVVCVLPASLKESPGETAEVKGKISEVITEGENTAVKLEPCELKK